MSPAIPPSVRVATIADAAAVATAHTRAWQAAYRGIVPDAHLDGLDLIERTEHWRQILSGEITVAGIARPTDYVAEVDGRVVGVANVGMFRHEPDNPDVGELWAMYVDPQHWGHGVGTALMTTTVDHFHAAALGRAHLWVIEGNHRACRFYERHGWMDDGVTDRFDIDGTEVTERRYSLAL